MNRPWFMALVVIACGLTAGLGVWQYQRGQQKQELLNALAQAVAEAPLTLTRDSAAGELPRRAQAKGRYDATRQLLLDNQTHRHQPGYHVWTPLRLNAGGVVVVSRGWLPADADRRVLPPLPTPEGEVTVRGLWRALPEPGFKVAPPPTSQPLFPGVVTYPDATEVGLWLGNDVAAGVLLLDADVPGGFVREWQSNFVGLAPSRHYGYAVTWFLLCATLLFLSLRINLKKSNE